MISFLCLGVLLFAGFGFMATFEPLPESTQVTWRIVYSVLGLLSLLGLIRVNLPRK
jgi:hypothetical protein